MACDVEYTDEFGLWWDELDESEQEDIAFVVRLLEERGTQLGYPHSSKIEQSKHGNMRELRIQHQGHPYRILYAFDPSRTGLLLIGGDKTGNDVGMTSTCLVQIGYTMSTWSSSATNRKGSDAWVRSFVISTTRCLRRPGSV